MLKKLPLSVALISKNEDKNLERTLLSIIEIASQIVIVDSGSTDHTLDIAVKYNCDIYHQDWLGYVAQKNTALNKCNQDWIFFLDCDEVPDTDLILEIRRIIENNLFGSYFLKRKTVYLDKLMKYSWQPDKQLRLVHKSVNPIYTGGKVHESLSVDGKVKELNGNLLHYSYQSISHHFEKTIGYAKLSAESYSDKSRKFSISNLIINPIYAFVNMYIFKGGFRDGIRGIIAAYSSMTGTFLKYAMLFEKDNQNQ
jgi:glycosyltransferase involved in cell wall biosynthesis